MKQTFFICQHCGNIVSMVRNNGVPIYCCGEKMREMVPGTVDAAQEKHIPIYQIHGHDVTVIVGTVEHPMTPEHYIEWVCLQTSQGSQHKKLEPNTSPQAHFSLSEGETIEAVYAFCNLHSLWKA